MRRVLLIVLCLAAAPAGAQAPPFQGDLLRLAGLMGALSHLQPLCGGPDLGWRGRMVQLMEAQELTSDDRQLYVGAFNAGFESLANIHRRCTAQTRTLIERYTAEGADIAARLGTSGVDSAGGSP